LIEKSCIKQQQGVLEVAQFNGAIQI